MILVDVATATSHFLSIQYTEHFCGYFFRIYSWFARQHPERHSNENLGLSGNYILLGASIPSKSKARSMVILKELTRHNRDFSRLSSPRSITLTFS